MIESYKMVYNRRIIIVLFFFILVIFGAAFFNYQMDDEIDIGFYDYEGYPENANLENGVCTVDDNMGVSSGEVIAEIPAVHVDAGSFILAVDHQNENDFEAIIFDGNDEIDRFALSSDETCTSHEFSSEDNLYNLRVAFLYNGNGTVTLKKSVLYSKGRPFYYDTILFTVIIIAAVCIICLLMIKYRFFELSMRDKAFWAILILFSFFSNYPFFRPFDTPAGGDIGFHISRIEGIYQGFKCGEFPPLLYPGVMHGRGMIGALYPHLWFAFPAILRLLHVSMEGAFRVFLIVINTVTCWTAYYSAKRITKNRVLALITMILYILLPYRLSAMTWRYAYGEALAYIFLPLVFAGMYEIVLGNKYYWPLLCLGMSGIIESHVVSALQMAEFCMIALVLYAYRLFRDRRLRYVLFSVGMTLLLNLWFICTFMYYYNSDIDVSVQTAGDMPYITYFLSQMLQFLPNNNNIDGRQLNHQVETVGLWLVFIFLTAAYIQFAKKERSRKDNFALVFLIAGSMFIFAASKAFPWETLSKFSVLYAFASLVEFPTRFYLMGQSLLLFGSIMTVGGADFSNRNIRKAVYIIPVVIAVLQGYIIVDSHLTRLKPFIDVRENRYTPNIADMIVYDFYAPYGYDHDDFPDTVSSPQASITDYFHKGIHTDFCYISPEETYVDIPLTYYSGYKAKLKDDGMELAISKGDKGCIRITLPKQGESSYVLLDFEGYDYGMITVAISTLSLLSLVVIFYRSGDVENEIQENIDRDRSDD